MDSFQIGLKYQMIRKHFRCLSGYIPRHFQVTQRSGNMRLPVVGMLSCNLFEQRARLQEMPFPIEILRELIYLFRMMGLSFQSAPPDSVIDKYGLSALSECVRDCLYYVNAGRRSWTLNPFYVKLAFTQTKPHKVT